MKKKYLFYSLIICLVAMLSSCSSTKKATYHHNRHTNNNNNTSQIDATKYLKDHNSKMTNYCISWVGVPHKMGGTDKSGVDCSGFVKNVYQDVFGITLPRTSGDMEKTVNIVDNQDDLQEGDLVFFNGGSGNKVNHVGIFINEDKFIHASTSKGVIVSSLKEKYWQNSYRSGGHHPQMKKHTKKHK
jgi:cell wall-associated NlpC family hydrolase